MAAKLYRAIGFMTGTSMDGLDGAILETDGESLIRPRACLSLPFDDGVRGHILAAVKAARAWGFEGEEPAEAFALAEDALTELHAEATAQLLEMEGLTEANIDVIGFHGQTVLHRAPSARATGRTRQLGRGAALARLTGIDVVNDFRAADVAAGGQGAPFAPLYHAALAKRDGLERPLGVVNLGGVGNITLIDADGGILAFDTGPANGPIDDWVGGEGDRLFDEGGALAQAGNLDEARLRRLLNHPYFETQPPKSLDRQDFTSAMAEGLSTEDGAALLTEFAAASVVRGLEWAAERPRRLIVTGGGRNNPVLMDALRRRAGVPVDPVEAVGWRGDVLEAELFAWLAVRSLRGWPLSVPATTGVQEPMTGGVLSRAAV
ncbi:MAG: anhydro-N-acetylmuramic acid kinase [Euryhalocaulis sp.]|uniref:anhydro-N-acetylmuramic acid kinase n=1 Tax=Euryhalocaulis sp. TaxID=2744307 RepID=UPI0017AE8623|nr:anhydro-N-acetylmuramic acid kinase [Euryhalocaulis sp.]MBA4800359.1 anhydro-N-acetylmuramic acid kinase [Euryhalocaulis sp.]